MTHVWRCTFATENDKAYVNMVGRFKSEGTHHYACIGNGSEYPLKKRSVKTAHFLTQEEAEREAINSYKRVIDALEARKNKIREYLEQEIKRQEQKLARYLNQCQDIRSSSSKQR